MAWSPKAPSDVLDYSVDWSKWLGGDSITASEWTLNSGTVTIDAKAADGKTTKVWVSGGEANVRNEMTNTITTTGGRTRSEQFTLLVRG